MARLPKTKKHNPAFAVIGEGITEHIYFNQLKQFEHLDFKLKPALPKNSGIKEIVKKANELLDKEYDTVFCVFDMDEINRDSAIREEYNALKRASRGKNIRFIENNPCMEFWFLLHYKRTLRQFNNYRQLELALKKHIPDYEKTARYLTAKNIYAHLKEKQDTARQHAVYTLRHEIPASSKSEMHHLLDALHIPISAPPNHNRMTTE